MMGRANTDIIPWVPGSPTISGSNSPGHILVNINWTNPRTTFGVYINIYADNTPNPSTLIDTVFVGAGGTNFTGNLSIGASAAFVRAELNYQPSIGVFVPTSAIVVAGPTAT